MKKVYYMGQPVCDYVVNSMALSDSIFIEDDLKKAKLSFIVDYIEVKDELGITRWGPLRGRTFPCKGKEFVGPAKPGGVVKRLKPQEVHRRLGGGTVGNARAHSSVFRARPGLLAVVGEGPRSEWAISELNFAEVTPIRAYAEDIPANLVIEGLGGDCLILKNRFPDPLLNIDIEASLPMGGAMLVNTIYVEPLAFKALESILEKRVGGAALTASLCEPAEVLRFVQSGFLKRTQPSHFLFFNEADLAHVVGVPVIKGNKIFFLPLLKWIRGEFKARASVVVTLGNVGGLVLDPEGVLHAWGVAEGKPIRKAGAGDTFVGVFFGSVVAGGRLQESIIAAASVADVYILNSDPFDPQAMEGAIERAAESYIVLGHIDSVIRNAKAKLATQLSDLEAISVT